MLRIVIADDEEKVCRLICGLIDWQSIDMEIVGVAYDGVKALELVSKLSPDLLITDIRMPGYDGLELIRRAKEQMESLEIIIISGYRHFEYAQTAVKYGVGDYLLKPINRKELLQTLEKIAGLRRRRVERLSNEERLQLQLQSDIDILRAGLFTDALLKQNGQTGSVAGINATYHYHFEEGCFQCVIAKLDCSYADDFRSSLGILQKKVQSILMEQMGGSRDIGVFCRESCVYCVLNFSADEQKQVRKKLRSVLDELLVQKSIFEKFQFTLCCGSCVESSEQLSDSLNLALLAVDERLVAGTDRLIEHVDLLNDREAVKAMLTQLSKAMESALAAMDKDGVLRSIGILEESVKARTKINGRDIAWLAVESYNTFQVLLRNKGYGLQNEEDSRESFRRGAEHCGSAEQLLEYLRKTAGQTLDLIIHNKAHAESKPIRLAKQYIQENYNKSITLDDVGRIAGFSPPYFSAVFKKETGSNFLEYLTQVRIEKAKELLKETDKNISDICNQVGYTDIKHFTKGFKKATMLKPNEYRKLYS